MLKLKCFYAYHSAGTFHLVLGIAIYFFAKKVAEIRRNINLGRDEEIKDNPAARWRNMVLLHWVRKKCSNARYPPSCTWQYIWVSSSST